MTNTSIIEQVMEAHPCYAVNGTKMYTYLECRRMIEEALKIKDEDVQI